MSRYSSDSKQRRSKKYRTIHDDLRLQRAIQGHWRLEMAREWEKLIERDADGRPICNCGQAYYAEDGEYMVAGGPNHGKIFHNGKHCKWGCSANQYAVKDEIAARVIAELETK